MNKISLSLFYIFAFSFVFAQNKDIKGKRILFVFDASGSMELEWENEKKYLIAKSTLLGLIDSLVNSNPQVELGLRVFGHQFHKSENNCKDSKLEVPFGTNNLQKFKDVLNHITPQGHTPIAYSLLQAAKDFPDKNKVNSIILITDGLENCNGAPCAASKTLNEKRISINPFIIGLDIADSLISQFKCIGSFVNAKNPVELKKVLQVNVAEATSKTQLIVNFLSQKDQLITNTPFSIIDINNNETLYTYIHSLQKNLSPDTLEIDPRGSYKIVANTFPPVVSSPFTITPSKLTEINLRLPKSYLKVEYNKQYDDKMARLLINQNGKWIYNYNLQDASLLAGTYQLHINLLPLKNIEKTLVAEVATPLNVAENGTLQIETKESINASIFYTEKMPWQLVKDLNNLSSNLELKLQPGEYSLVYLKENARNSSASHRYDFEIFKKRTTVVVIK